MYSDLTNKSTVTVQEATISVSDTTYLQEYKYSDTAMWLYVIVCVLFHLKCRNINAYALKNCGL